MMTHILVVEDEILINELIEEFLTENSYTVTPCFDGNTALELFREKNFDLIILDIMLPGKSGLDILKEIRTVSNVPIIMLTAMSDEQTQLISFNHQVDDFIVKPFSPTILVKRIENIFRHYTEEAPNDSLEHGSLRLTCSNQEVFYKGVQVLLTKKEFDILYYLLKNQTRMLTRDQLINHVWEYDAIVSTRIIDNHIRSIRKKLPDVSITTIKGIGFKMGNVL